MDALNLGDVFYYCTNWSNPIELSNVALCRVYEVQEERVAIEWYWPHEPYQKGTLLTGYDLPQCRRATEEQWMLARMKNYYDGKVEYNGS